MKPNQCLSKILFAAALTAAACFTVNQASAASYSGTIATWSVGSLTNGGNLPPALFTNDTVAPGGQNVIIFPMTKGSGLTNNITTAGVYGSAGWTNNGIASTEANSIANGLYISYAIQAAPGYTISFSTNYISYHNSATGPFNGELQYSSDGINYSDVSSLTYAQGNVAASGGLTNDLTGVAVLQNVPSTTTNFFRLVNWGATGTAGTWYITNSSGFGGGFGTNDFVVDGTLSAASVTPPSNPVVTPSSLTLNAGQTAAFTVTAAGFPAGYTWYQIFNATTNAVPGATNATITLPNVLGANAGGYFVILTNASGSATSSVVNLTITNDPAIQAQPASTYGILGSQIQFAVKAFGTAPLSYSWYFAKPNGIFVSLINNGSTTPSGAVFSGATSNVLTLSNVKFTDPTNFVVVVANGFGSITSSVASLVEVTNIFFTYQPPYFSSEPGITPITLWDFNGPEFTNTAANPTAISSPVPYLGVGTAFAVGSSANLPTSPFSGSVDPNNGLGFDQIIPGIDHLPPLSWGSSSYPANSATVNSNKLNGVQFNVSTLGAKNVFLSYDSRVSGTASDYERVQYTTNGTSWIDYPSSSTFNNIASTYVSYANDFSGFPGVANNANFGVRIVTEFQSTATYGIGPSNSFVGTGNSYSTAGTVTYDLVGIFGDAITNNNVPPVISPITNVLTGLIVTNETTLDNVPITNTFTVSGDTAPNKFIYSATSLSTTIAPSFQFISNAPGSYSMVVIPNPISGNIAAGPILMSVTDTNGDVSKSWFYLTLTSQFPAPTNNLTIPQTNTLANTALSIPFKVGSPLDSVHQFTYSGSSANNTVVPSANVIISTNSPANATNPVVTITPASNQLGVAVISVTINDNNTTEGKSTTASIPFMVRPNTNIVALDFFNYDGSGALDTISDGYWQHLSGNFHTMTVNSSPNGGTVTVDTLNNTENLQTPLIGAPYSTNAAAKVTQLYYSFVINMQDTGNMPTGNGTYMAAFNDGSGNTANVEDLLVFGTNGAAPGNYRIGIADNSGATTSDARMVPFDLVPGSNYVIVTSLTLSNGVSSLWINPSSQSSSNVTRNADAATVKFNIGNFELRQSGGSAGAVTVSFVKAGMTFNSVLQTPVANSVSYQVPFGSAFSVAITNLSTAAGWFDPNGLPLTVSSVGPSANGTNVTTDGVNINYGTVVSVDNFSYTISDGFESVSSSVFLSPILQFNGSQTVNGSGHPVISGTSPVGAAGSVYGVESRTNLIQGLWIEAGNTTVGGTGAWSFTDTHQTNPPTVFYRLYFPDNPGNPPQ